jgi:hypothetical protein
MARNVLIEQLHIDLFVSDRLSTAESSKIVRTLGRPRFRAELLQAIQAFCERYPTLRNIRVVLSR